MWPPHLVRKRNFNSYEMQVSLRWCEFAAKSQVDELSQLAFDWTCPRCEQEMYVGPVQRIAHHATCVEAEEADRKKTEDADGADLATAAASAKPNSRAYECADCGGRTLFLTSTEILRHKRSHMTETDK